MQNQEFMPPEQEFERPRSVNADPREQRQQQAPPEYMGQEPYQDVGMQQGAGAKIYPQQAKRRRGLGWLIVLFVIIAIMAMGGLGRSFDRGGFSAPQSSHPMQAYSQVYQVTGTPRLVINGANGEVHIHTGGKAGTVTIQQDGASGNAGSMVTRSEGNTGTIIDVNTSTGSAFSDGNVTFDITVPDATNLDVHATDGSVDVNGVNGQITAATTNGSIQLENVQGQITLQSEDGSITANNISGQVVATSNTGSISLEHAKLSGQSSLTTKNASINFQGSLDPSGTYNFESGNDSVDVTLPDNSSFQLTTSTNGGTLQNDFGTSTVGSAPHASLSIKTGDGSINLHKASQ